MNRIIKLIIYSVIISLFFLNAYYIVHQLAEVIYVGEGIPPNEINPHTFQGISIIVLLFLITFSITGTFFGTLLVVNVCMYLFIYANHLKYVQRGEVINFYEFRELMNIKELSNIAPLTQVFFLIGVAIVVFLFVFKLENYFSNKYNFKFSKIARILILSLSVLCLIPFYVNSEKVTYSYFELEKPKKFVFNPTKEIKRIGFIPYFMNNISRDFMDEPKGYSRDKIKDIKNQYVKLSIRNNRKRLYNLADERTIIYLSESLWQDEIVTPNNLPAPYIDSMANLSGGKMISPFIGGGTANVEFSVLTSMSLDLHKTPQLTSPYIEYFSKSKSSSSILTMVNSRKRAVIHPYTFDLYNRKEVYKKMHISHLYDSKSMKNYVKIPGSPRISDMYLTDYLNTKLNQFSMINVLSMQNHLPYKQNILSNSTYKPVINHKLFSSAPPKDNFADYIGFAEGYFKQVRYTDKAVEKLIADLNQSSVPTNIVFYGDHAPSFMRGKEKLIGDNVFKTPYFIYNSKRHFKQKETIIGPEMLVPTLLKEGDYKLSPYYELLDEILSQGITRIASDSVYKDNKKIADSKLSKNEQKLINDYRYISFNRYFDKNTISDDFFQKIY
ncbi:LTA synthase family protein [Macrococcus lamae]|uniref:LTA synthase family protein n=1 Tax=Macrococcus lamae TaxID=198484 RepID=A0A4R6BVL1_9STAP|nr:LTA synthase family protein [Macrococcus lamae]TDM12401.1 LTA synthase family protein [Macrococcus lamae]